MFQVVPIVFTSALIGTIVTAVYGKLDRRIEYWRVIVIMVLCGSAGYFLTKAGFESAPAFTSALAAVIVSVATKGSVFVLLPLVAAVTAVLSGIAYLALSGIA